MKGLASVSAETVNMPSASRTSSNLDRAPSTHETGWPGCSKSRNRNRRFGMVCAIVAFGLLGTIASRIAVAGDQCDRQRQMCFQRMGHLAPATSSSATGVAYVVGNEPLVVGNSGVVIVKYADVGPVWFTGDSRFPSSATDAVAVGTTTVVTGKRSEILHGTQIEVQSAMRWVHRSDGPVGSLDFLYTGGAGTLTSGNSVSDDGTAIVGTVDDGAGMGPRAIRWTPAGGVVNLPSLGPIFPGLHGNGVSPNGVFSVGDTASTSGLHAFIFPQPHPDCRQGCPTVSQGMGDLPGGLFSSTAHAVTDSGIAVGSSVTAFGREAFRWTPPIGAGGQGIMTSLGDFPGGSTLSEATDISNDGEIVVGFGTTGTIDRREAFLWRANLGLRNLQELITDNIGPEATLDWRLTNANAISTNGLAIAGDGTNPSGQPEGWFVTLPDCNAATRPGWDGLEAPAPFTNTVRSVLPLVGSANNFLTLPSPTAALRLAGPMTIEAWVFLEAGGGGIGTLISHGQRDGSHGEDSSNNVLYEVVITSDGAVRVAHERSNASDATVLADTSLRTGLWYHLAVVRHVDGDLVEYVVHVDDRTPILLNVSGPPAGGTNGQLRIGANEGTASRFSGYIADARIWNLARTAGEIQAWTYKSPPPDAAGLVAAWRMDEESGTTVFDSVGSNNLTLDADASRTTVGADCNQNRIPDECEIEIETLDCNGNDIPDDCDFRDGRSQDCNHNGRADECDASDALTDLFDAQGAAAELFRNAADKSGVPPSFDTMIERYGRPWQPETEQTPGRGLCTVGTTVCFESADCPDGVCNPPGGSTVQRDAAERFRMLARGAACLPTEVARRVLNELFSFEMLLGNEAFADAMDPTVGLGEDDDTISLEQVPGMFAFNGLPQIDELIEEELGLLRGREIGLPPSVDDPMVDGDPTDPNVNYPLLGTATRPCAVYNRLRPNAVPGINSVAYRANYGFSNNPDNGAASMKFPQGHGDAYGYYLTATKSYLNVFGAAQEIPVLPDFSRRFIASQTIPDGVPDCGGADCDAIVDDVPDSATHHVGFKSVRNMAAAMAARARTVNRIVDLTFRADYVEPKEDFLHRPVAIPLTDTVPERAWGMADWARRGAVGAYLDWAVLNHLVPPPTPGQPDSVESVHRERFDEINILASAVDEMQERVDAAGAGLNPLGLMPNVVPFRVIDANGLENFLTDGGDSGKSHYGIVRAAALDAIENARGILRRANAAENRLRDTSEVADDFVEQIADSEFGLRNRLIEIFGLPSPSDRTDNDFEDNDGDGAQMNGAFNDPEDDAREAAGSPDLRNFMLDEQAVQALHWAPRGAPGQIQLALFELRTANSSVETAVQKLSNLEADIGVADIEVKKRRDEGGRELEIQSDACDRRMDVIDAREDLAEEREDKGGWLKDITSFVAGAVSCLGLNLGGDGDGDPQNPKVNPVSCGASIGQVLDFADEQLYGAKTDAEFRGSEFDLARQEQGVNCWETAKLTGLHNEPIIRAAENQLQALIRETPLAKIAKSVAENQALQAVAVVNKNLQEGKRLVAERDRIRRVQRDKLQNFRYKDLAFRTFRNHALEQYGAFFDLAARYVMLATRAFAYEYNERDFVDGQVEFLYRERLLGTTFAVDQGLQSVLAALDAERQRDEFTGRLKKLRLFDQGFPFSIRKSMLGLEFNPSTDTDQQQFEKSKAFRAFLETHIVQDIRDVPAYRDLAVHTSDEDYGPALVLTFPTEVAGGTLFGAPSTNVFGTDANYNHCENPKIFTFLIQLQGVDSRGVLGNTTGIINAFFLPAGASMLRAPLGFDCARRPVRSWAVVDQKIPVVGQAYRDAFDILDAPIDGDFDRPLGETAPGFGVINRFPYVDAEIAPNSVRIDRFPHELAGWSVWNTQWVLIIPGRQFTSSSDTVENVRRQLMILIYDANENGEPRRPDENLGIDDIVLRILAYGKKAS